VLILVNDIFPSPAPIIPPANWAISCRTNEFIAEFLAQLRGARAPRVLVAAPRRNNLFLLLYLVALNAPWSEKFAMARAPSPARGVRALPGIRDACLSRVSSLKFHRAIFQGMSRHLNVVKRHGVIGELLISFVTFTG